MRGRGAEVGGLIFGELLSDAKGVEESRKLLVFVGDKGFKEESNLKLNASYSRILN